MVSHQQQEVVPPPSIRSAQPETQGELRNPGRQADVTAAPLPSGTSATQTTAAHRVEVPVRLRDEAQHPDSLTPRSQKDDTGQSVQQQEADHVLKDVLGGAGLYGSLEALSLAGSQSAATSQTANSEQDQNHLSLGFPTVYAGQAASNTSLGSASAEIGGNPYPPASSPPDFANVASFTNQGSEQPTYYGYAPYQALTPYYTGPASAGMSSRQASPRSAQSIGIAVAPHLIYAQQYRPCYPFEGQPYPSYPIPAIGQAGYAQWVRGGASTYTHITDTIAGAQIGGHNRQASLVSESLDLTAFGHSASFQVPYAGSAAADTGSLLSQSQQHLPFSDRPPATGRVQRRPSHHSPSGDLRSEHVLWVGNVPTDATKEELLAFFSTLPSLPRQESDTESAAQWPHGILSIFIIARSNCAFVNYTTSDYLHRAVEFFSGEILRPYDPRCPKLVCRIRKKDDEAAAGVSGQRGRGIHVGWLREHNQRLRASTQQSKQPQHLQSLPSPHTTRRILPEVADGDAAKSVQTDHKGTSCFEGSSTTVTPRSATHITASITEPHRERTASESIHSTSDPSYASTNSEVLSHPAFSKRYFVLKSHNTAELDKAVETQSWITQSHNESFLDQAYRRSELVYLFFSANQSGQFYGYAKMTGPILPSRTDASQGAVSSSGRAVVQSPKIVGASPATMTPADELDEKLLSGGPGGTGASVESTEGRPKDLVWNGALGLRSSNGTTPTSTAFLSPLLNDGTTDSDVAASADDVINGETISNTTGSCLPDSVGGSRNPSLRASISMDSRAVEQHVTRSLIHNLRVDQYESQYKAEALQRMLDIEGEGGSGGINDGGTISTEAVAGRSTRPSSSSDKAAVASPSPGHPFQIEWLQTLPLPFANVKYLKNPWNDNKSVRIGRDGTEIAIEVGAELVQIWEVYARQQKEKLKAA